MSPGRYFGSVVWNAEKPSVLLPMRAISLLVPFILTPCVFTYENDALRRDGLSAFCLPNTLRRGSNRAYAGVTYIMRVPVSTLLLSLLIRKAILQDH